jgi:flavin reductase (DIM6/NTAB) family NADH-FMN oxidoreductase RutF
MITFNPSEMPVAGVQNILQAAVGPRPIAFASTIDSAGEVNLSPFSFFNVFSANPPILIFSPARRVRDNTTKHTLENVLEVAEVVINVVNFDMVQQMSLSSTEYQKGVNEFEKAGFTAIPSETIKPPRVAESPVQFECEVQQVIALGEQGGAGNLIICLVKRIHVNEAILNQNNQIDQHKIDLVSRLGGNWYCRANGDALFEVEKPLTTLGIGVDQIPTDIRFSPVLTGNHLGQLGNVEALPDQESLQEFKQSEIYALLLMDIPTTDFVHHRVAARLLDKGDTLTAWKVLLAER